MRFRPAARNLLSAEGIDGGKHIMAQARILILLSILLNVLPVQARAETLHVALAGSDSADCSIASPCRTIAHGVSRATPGDLLIVHSGVYRERVRVMTSGTGNTPLTIRAEGDVETDGFRIDGSWVVIMGFRIDHGCLAGALGDTTCRYTGTTSNPNVYGFWVTGSDVTLRGNFVTGTLWGGVFSSGARNRILNNRFIRTGHPGMMIQGSYNLIEGNEVADVMPYFYGPEGQWGQDQDGIRIFGTGHVLRGNYIHDIYSRREAPHRDGMQTFDNNGPEFSLIDVVIEANTFFNTANSGMLQSRYYGLSKNVVWRNNIFVNGDSHMIQAWLRDVRFEGNIFYIVRNSSIASAGPGEVEGNTFLWVRGTYPAITGITGRNNRAHPNPVLHDDPIRTEPGGVVARPNMRNIPIAVFRTVAQGTNSTLYLAPGDASQLHAGSIVEIDSDGFARTVQAVDAVTGRIDFTPAISGAMARVPGSALPADFGQWRIAAAGRAVAVWPTTNVTPDFTVPGSTRAPTNLRIIR